MPDEDEEPANRRAANTGYVGGCLANRLKDDRAYALLDSGLLWQFVAFAKRQGRANRRGVHAFLAEELDRGHAEPGRLRAVDERQCRKHRDGSHSPRVHAAL
jgi:hypothetical protein